MLASGRVQGRSWRALPLHGVAVQLGMNYLVNSISAGPVAVVPDFVRYRRLGQALRGFLGRVACLPGFRVRASACLQPELSLEWPCPS